MCFMRISKMTLMFAKNCCNMENQIEKDNILTRAQCFAARIGCNKSHVIAGYTQGAMDEYERLTKWIDPSESLPEEGVDLLFKTADGEIYLGYRQGKEWSDANGMYTHDEQLLDEGWDRGFFNDLVIGWRPIWDE